jgi:hypothetical protein
LGREHELVLVAAPASSGAAGWVHAAEQETLESGRRCEIVELVVDAAHRRSHGKASGWVDRRGDPPRDLRRQF